MDSLVNTLAVISEIDVAGTVEELQGLLAGLRTEVAAMQLPTIARNLDEAVQSANQLLGNPELKSAITNLNESMAQIHGLTTKLNTKADPLLANAETDMKNLGEMLDEARAALVDVRAQLAPASPLNRELVETLHSADKTLTSLRHLIEQLKRNPNSIIAGKKPEHLAA